VRRTTTAVVVVAFMLSAGLAVWGETPELKPAITDITVFKDGHALIMARSKVKLDDGTVRTRDVPAPLLGTFWAFVTDKNARVEHVRAGFVKTSKDRACLTFDEMLEANVGRNVKITEKPDVQHSGKLLGLLEHEDRKDVRASRTEPAGYDMRGRYIRSRTVTASQEQETKQKASFVMLSTGKGVKLIKRENIKNLEIEGDKPATTHTEAGKAREISMYITSGAKPAVGDYELGVVYMQKGVRWIPNYRVELLAGGKARISLQGTIINELADFENANLRLVVGVPSFIMKEQLSPLALREIGINLSSYFQPPRRGRRGSQYGYLSNAMMSQRAGPSRAPAAPPAGAAAFPGQGRQEDLFLYHKPGVSMKKGERMVVQLFEETVSYKDIYTWDVPPVPPRQTWRYVNRDQQLQMLRALTGAKAVHQARLENKSKFPWTTGPATIYRDGTPLAQQLLTYTSVNNSVDLPITIATDLHTSKEDAEAKRERNHNFGGRNYGKVLMNGKLTVKSFKDEDVHIIVKRRLFGTATKASTDGKIKLLNVMEEASWSNAYPWYSSWPSWWYNVNTMSEIVWEFELEKGKSVTLECGWQYYYRQ